MHRKKSYKYSGGYYRNVKNYLKSKSNENNIEEISEEINNIETNVVSFASTSNAYSQKPSNENLASNKMFENAMDEEISDEEDEHIFENIEIDMKFREQLKVWAIQVPHKKVNELLKIINETNRIKNLPKDARTLLQTPRKVNIVSMGPEPNGVFWNQGLETCLLNSIKTLPCEEILKMNEVMLNFNIDGLPLHKSSKYEFWPILATIFNLPNNSPLTIAIYCGTHKPNLSEFLQDFVRELDQLMRNGLKVNEHQIAVKVRCFICDSPARAFMKGTVNFNHKHGCTKCTVEGEYYKDGHHTSFPRLHMPLRTNDSFRQREDEDHHKETSPLENLKIDLVEDFVIADCLHLFHLGITKKCLVGWVHGSFNFKTKLSAREILQISNLLQNSNKTLPTEIHRAVRGLDCLKFWKGLEFRTFLMYLGPIILKDFLSSQAYSHFLLFFCAVTICSSKMYFCFLDIAQSLFDDYIEEFINLYGIDSIGSNVHNLHHVVNDVRKFSSLNSISSYPFENHLFLLKSLLRSGKSPLQQVAMRIGEHVSLNLSNKNNLLSSNYPLVHGKNNLRHSIPNCNGVFNKVDMKEYFLKTDNKNKWFLTKENEIVAMLNATYFKNSVHIFGNSIVEKKSFFKQPIDSSFLHIFISNGILNEAKLYSVDNIKCKLVSLNYNNDLVFLPLIHTLE